MSSEELIDNSNKVKRKEISTNNEKKKIETIITPDMIYKQTVDHEEAEALSRNADKDMKLYMENCSTLKNYILQLASETNMSPSKKNEIKKDICLTIVLLKKLNRLEKYRLKNVRETLQGKKLKVDSYNLQLQNLRYEICHLKKEVVKCLQFKSKDEDIDLVDEETFFTEAPESISRLDITKKDPHQLKLARLEWELKQRKDQSELCQKVENENENVAVDINKKRSQLDSLAPMLKQILCVAKPLQENLGYPECPTRPQYKLVNLLPEPLYCLFVQTDAYRQACSPNIEVKINGNEEDAEKINKLLNDVQLADSDSDNEEPVEKSSSKHRHSKSYSSTSDNNNKIIDKLEDKKQKLCLAHPLSIDIIFHSVAHNSTSAHASISTSAQISTPICSFFYYYNLHIVSVKVSKDLLTSPLKDNYEILGGLFPLDFIENNLNTPNITNYYQLKQYGLTFDTSKYGYPYVWVQRMAGLDFLKSEQSLGTSGSPSSNSTSLCINEDKVSVDINLSQMCIPNIIKKLKIRFKSTLELSTLLVQLENGQLLGQHHCNLILWQTLSWSQYESCEFTQHHVNAQHVSKNWLYFKTILSRGIAKLTAYVAINYDYPIIPPIFAIQIDINKILKQATNDDAVRDIEKELNVYWKELSNNLNMSQSILRSQIECLASCFDIYLECLDMKEFPKKKTFIKSVRGCTRSRPYKYNSKPEQIYSQR